MPHTDHLALLVDQLRTNTTLQEAWDQNPATAIAPFEITGHERDAVLTRDSNDFVALGIVASIWELPWRLRNRSRLVDIVARLRDLLRRRLLQWLPERPDFPRPRPEPEPRPGPRPEPEPRPGPRPEPEPRPGPRPEPRPGPRPGPEPGPRPGPDPPGPRPGPDPPGPDG